MSGNSLWLWWPFRHSQFCSCLRPCSSLLSERKPSSQEVCLFSSEWVCQGCGMHQGVAGGASLRAPPRKHSRTKFRLLIFMTCSGIQCLHASQKMETNAFINIQNGFLNIILQIGSKTWRWRDGGPFESVRLLSSATVFPCKGRRHFPRC